MLLVAVAIAVSVVSQAVELFWPQHSVVLVAVLAQ